MSEQAPQIEQEPQFERHSEEHTSAQIQRIGAAIVNKAETYGVNTAERKDYSESTVSRNPETETDTTLSTTPTLDNSGNTIVEKIRYGEDTRGKDIRGLEISADKESFTSKDEVGGAFLKDKIFRPNGTKSLYETKSPMSNKEIRAAAANIFSKQRAKLNAEKQKRDEIISS